MEVQEPAEEEEEEVVHLVAGEVEGVDLEEDREEVAKGGAAGDDPARPFCNC